MRVAFSPITKRLAASTHTRCTTAAAVTLYAFVVCALAFTFVTTPLWSMIRETRLVDLSFEQLHRGMYFQFPIDAINAKLNDLLPISQPVSLGRGITNRTGSGAIATGVYPRSVDRRSRYILDVVPASRPRGGSVDLVPAPGGVARLYGLPFPRPSTARPRPDLYAFSWIGFVAALLGVIGWGLAVRRLLSRFGHRGPPEIDAILVPLGAVLLFGVVATLATWLQAPVPWRVVVGLGAAVCVATVAGQIHVPRLRTAIARLSSAPELIIVLALVVFLFVRQSKFPVSAWDPRTIWMLAAKRLAHDGMITRHDMLAPALARFTHPGYPLVFPATMTVLGAFTPANERMLAMGTPVLFGSITMLVWILSRRVLGRWVGLAFTMTVALTVPQLASWGNADPFIVLLLAASILAFSRDDTRLVGWISLSIAALTKQEGLFFAMLIAIGFLAFETRFRWKERRQVLALMWLAPAAVQMFLVRVAWRLPEDFSRVRSDALNPTAVSSHATLLRHLLPWTLTRFGLLRIGLAALPLAVALCISRRRTAAGAVATGTAIIGVLFFTGLMFTVPLYATRSAAGPSLYRVFLHSAVLATLGVLLPLRSVFTPADASAAAKRSLKRGRMLLADVIDPGGRRNPVSPKSAGGAGTLG